MPGPFKGTINLDIRDSKPDWDAFLDAKAPKNAPNVLVILYDDTGQAATSSGFRPSRSSRVQRRRLASTSSASSSRRSRSPGPTRFSAR